MAPLLTPDTFEFFARYLLAGFIFLSMRARFVIGERPKPSETIVEAVILSLLNQMVFYLGFAWLPVSMLQAAEGRGALFIELSLAAVLGLLSGYFLSRNWVPDGVRRLILPVTRPVPDAFEHALIAANTPCFILVAYKDNREVAGYFGERSYAGTAMKDGGIYLESLFLTSEAGPWNEVVPKRSAWISLDDVRSIEFFDLEETNNAEGSV